jgi:hypothetical protein
MNDQPTCGQGLAHHAVLPRAISRLAASMSTMMDSHLDALASGASSEPERAAYARLATDYRTVAASLAQIATQMESYRDLPMATHDQSRLASRESAEIFQSLVDAERNLLLTLQASVEQHEQMLSGARP